MRPGSLRTVALLAAIVTASSAGGCATQLQTLPGVLGPEAYPPAMVLATGASGEDCGRSILFVPLHRPELARAVAQAIASVPEATLLTDAEVETTTLTTGVYNHTCVRVRGSAAKLVSTVVIPAPAGHHGHHGHPGH